MNIKTIKPGMKLSVLQATMISAMKRKPTTRTIVDAATPAPMAARWGFNFYRSGRLPFNKFRVSD